MESDKPQALPLHANIAELAWQSSDQLHLYGLDKSAAGVTATLLSSDLPYATLLLLLLSLVGISIDSRAEIRHGRHFRL